MPQLPTAQDLGVPDLSSSRPIASWDTSAAGRGAAAGGAAIKAGGDAMASTGFAIAKSDMEKAQQKADTLADAQATSNYLIGKTKIDAAREDETDPTALDGYRQKYQANLDAAAEGLSPSQRQLWLAKRAPDVETGGVAADNRAFTLKKSQSFADLGDRLAALSKSGIDAKTEEDRVKIIDAGAKEIQTRLDAGFYTPEEAANARRKWATGFAFDRVSALPPGDRLATAIGGAEGALIQRESGGNPRAENKWGYAGLYQFGAPLLNTLGLYQPGAGENLQSWSKTGKDAPGKWGGTFNIPGFPTVKTLDDFMANPAAQRAAYQASTAYYDREFADRGMDKYIGKTIQGTTITRDGLYAMAHLGGVGGAQSALVTGGGSDARDANGSSVLSYARMAANAGPRGPAGGMEDFLTPQQRTHLADGAMREIVRADRDTQIQATAERASVKSLLQDDEASVMSTGKPIAELNSQRVEKALGPEAAATFTQNRQQAQRYYDETHDWEQIPADQVRTRLEGLKPQGGQAGYASQQQYFEAAQTKAKGLLKERDQDPAAAADRLPAVQQAKQAALPNDPAGTQAVAKARMTAQAQIGIPESARTPITKAEALEIAAPLTNALLGQEKKVLQQVIPALDKAYGPHAQRALEFALQASQQDDATAKRAAVIFRQLHMGQNPSQSQLEELQKAQTNDAIAKAGDPQPAAVRAPGSTVPQAVIDTTSPLTGTPTDQDITDLIQNPSHAERFNGQFGRGSADRALKAYADMTRKPQENAR